MKGKVFLVGAGPGDPKLITVKALEVLQQADVVIYDRLISPQLLMYTRADALKVYVGKEKDRHTLKQEEINENLVRYALQGKTVVRLKGGDPTIFGRVGEEANELVKHDIPFEIVPGVSSVYAVPAYAGIPITHRDHASSFYVVTGHEKPEKLVTSLNWQHLAHAADTLIFLMGVSRIETIREQLLRHGRSPATPVALIRWGTRAEQATLICTLDDVADKVKEMNFLPPAVIVIGDVVQLRNTLQWAENRPLFGKRILVTRARSQASEMIRQIEQLGGEAISFPVLAIKPVQDEKRLAVLDEALDQLKDYTWLVFTSVNGVQCFFRRMRERRIDVRSLAHARIAAVGPKTAEELEERGLMCEPLPDAYQAEGLVDKLLPLLQPSDKVLIPRSSIARDVLPQALREAGIEVRPIDVYDNVPVDDHADWIVEMLQHGDIDIITFASSSSVKYFVESLRGQGISTPQDILGQVKIACIGPITEATVKEYGLEVSGTAKEATIDSMIDLLQQL